MSKHKETIRITPGAERLVESLGLHCVRDGWRENLPGKIVHDRGDRQVLRITIPDTGQLVYLKRWRFSESSPYHSFPGKNALRQRAATEFDNLKKLRTIGIRVPEPLFLAEERGMWGTVATLLLLEGLTGYVSASEWIHEHPGEKEFLCREIARLMAVLHRHNYYYRSPGLKHFYVRNQEIPASTPEDQMKKVESAGSVDSNIHGHEQSLERLALIDVPRLDRGDCPFFRSIRHKLGADPPCPERDLSKVLLTLTQELGAGTEDLRTFWTTYFQDAGIGPSGDSFRQRVTELARIRSGRRQRKAGVSS